MIGGQTSVFMFSSMTDLIADLLAKSSKSNIWDPAIFHFLGSENYRSLYFFFINDKLKFLFQIITLRHTFLSWTFLMLNFVLSLLANP